MNANKPETLRLFLALWPDDAVRTSIMQLQAPVSGRIIPYANLHLTLAFLGQQPAKVVDDAVAILHRLVSPPMVLILDRLGYFARNRIAWLGMNKAPEELLALQGELAEALHDHRIPWHDQQTFKPHITLARDASLPPDMIFNPISWQADCVALVKSVTNAEGAIYEVLASRSLDKALRTQDVRKGEAGRFE